MSEIIHAIVEWKGKFKDSYGEYAGYKVYTSEQEITLAIDDEGSCCEQWGYFLTEDDTTKFIGAELKDVRIVNTLCSSHPLKFDESYVDEGAVMFVNLLTSKGTLQFVAYNSHNGYYGHDAIVESKQLTENRCL